MALAKMQPKALLVLSALWICAPSVTQAKYLPPPLYDLVGVSDLIVLGSISRVTPDTFFLEVEEVLKGSGQASVVEIERFRDWACSSRWQPYAKGQKVVAFLARREGPYRLRSAGAEAEFPVRGRYAVVPAWSILQGLETHHGHDNDLPDQALISIDDLRALISGFSACFELRTADNRFQRVEHVETICDEDVLAEFRSRSGLHESLVRMTLELIERLEAHR